MKQEILNYTIRKENKTGEYLLVYKYKNEICFYSLTKHYHCRMSYFYYLTNTKIVKKIDDLPNYEKKELSHYTNDLSNTEVKSYVFKQKLINNI